MTDVTPEARSFQEPLGQVIATPAPLGLRLWPGLAALLVAGLVLVASLVQVDIVVSSGGRLAAAAPPVVLKPLNAAVLREVLVHPGDVVRAGQVLARLDATFPAADRAALAAQHAAALAEVARLEAELAGAPLQIETPEAALQAQVMAERAALAAAQRQSLNADIAAVEEAIAAETRNGAGLDQQLAIAREVEAMRVKLASGKAGSRLSAMEAEVVRLSAEADLRDHTARLEGLAQQLSAAKARAAAHDLDLRRKLLEDLAQARPRLAMLQEELAKATALSARSDLIAPRPGVVLAVAASSAGSLVGSGEAVLTLVPTDVPLIAEINLRSADAGRVAAGDEVWVKVDAFPWRKHGKLTGTLREVGQSSTVPPGGNVALHVAQVTFPAEALHLSDMPPGTALLPGMTLTAEIRTGTRSVLGYFLDPLLRGLQESLREP